MRGHLSTASRAKIAHADRERRGGATRPKTVRPCSFQPRSAQKPTRVAASILRRKVASYLHIFLRAQADQFVVTLAWFGGIVALGGRNIARAHCHIRRLGR